MTPYYRPQGGGLERYAEAILTRLASRGHHVEVLSFGAEAGTQTQEGVRVHRCTPSFRLGSTPIRRDFSERVEALIMEMRPDVVLAHTPVPFPAEMAYRAARRQGVPLVLTYHSGRLRGSSPLLNLAALLDRWTLERRMLRYASALVAVSPYVRDHALRRHQHKVLVVPPGVGARRFAPRGPVDAATILFVGPVARSYRWKGLDTLREAFLRVREARPEARLHIIGNGDRFDEVWDWGRAVGNVQMDRRLSEEGLIAAYQRATVTVLPSTTDAEAFGMVLAEANACGRPVVGTRVGGIPDFVRPHENGLLSPPRDSDALAKRILEVLENPAFADEMGTRGRALVLHHHDWDRLTLLTEGLLEEVLGADESRPQRRARAASLERRPSELVKAPQRVRAGARRAQVVGEGVRRKPTAR